LYDPGPGNIMHFKKTTAAKLTAERAAFSRQVRRVKPESDDITGPHRMGTVVEVFPYQERPGTRRGRGITEISRSANRFNTEQT